MVIKQRIGLFGGSFNPVHNGHISLALASKKELKLKKVIFIPAALPPHKKTVCLAPKKHRLNMIKIALKKHAFFEISRFELKRKRSTYTYQTVQYFIKKYPKKELFLIIGSDSLRELNTWKKPEFLLKKCSIVVGKRGKIPVSTPLIGNRRILRIKESIPPVSSSYIRYQAGNKRSIRGLVPKNVERYILKNSLYSK
ncbi:MAG: nicotinate (nicotinamide) nucleotide adenylyltransferase [Endomicrobiales bacterium]|nr:nicotinate (nicotinamide) nucleotide adenylyltransferase [Endomicrobiales bacterium]